MFLKYDFKKNFQVNITDREEWKNGPARADDVWYTDE